MPCALERWYSGHKRNGEPQLDEMSKYDANCIFPSPIKRFLQLTCGNRFRQSIRILARQGIAKWKGDPNNGKQNRPAQPYNGFLNAISEPGIYQYSIIIGRTKQSTLGYSNCYFLFNILYKTEEQMST